MFLFSSKDCYSLKIVADANWKVSLALFLNGEGIICRELLACTNTCMSRPFQQGDSSEAQAGAWVMKDPLDIRFRVGQSLLYEPLHVWDGGLFGEVPQGNSDLLRHAAQIQFEVACISCKDRVARRVLYVKEAAKTRAPDGTRHSGMINSSSTVSLRSNDIMSSMS